MYAFHQPTSGRLRGRGTVLILLVASLLPATVWGQNRPAIDFLEQLVDGLIDSQSVPPQNPRRGPSPTRRSDPQMRELRASLTGFAQAVSDLVRTLYQDVNRTPGLRTLMGEALQMNAQATLMARMSAERDNAAQLSEEFADVDQRWRLLSFRLKQLRNLSSQAANDLRRADEFHQRVTQALQLTPQLDREAIVRQATTLSTDLMRLLEEIDFEVSDYRVRQQLLVAGRRAYQQARRVASVASRTQSLTELQREYRDFEEAWQPFASRLRPLNVRYLDRQLQRVQAADRSLRELLLLRTEVDRSELLYLTEVLQRDLDELMDTVTLRQLTQLSVGRDEVVSRASDFYSACRDFADCVRNGESVETMADLYSYLDNHWQPVSRIVRNADQPEAQQIHRQLNGSIIEIRDVLSIRPPYDPERVLQLAAQLENLAAHFEHDLRSAIASRPNTYPAEYRARVLAASKRFREATQQLSSELGQNSSRSRLSQIVQVVANRWQELSPTIVDFPNSIDREHLLLIRKQVAPIIVDLQAMGF